MNEKPQLPGEAASRQNESHGTNGSQEQGRESSLPAALAESTAVQLSLYVAPGAPNSTLALANLQSICEQYLSGRHTVEVVDILRDPNRALRDGIIATPTLVKFAPLPAVKIIGNLNNREKVRNALGLRDFQI